MYKHIFVATLFHDNKQNINDKIVYDGEQVCPDSTGQNITTSYVIITSEIYFRHFMAFPQTRENSSSFGTNTMSL